MGSKYSKLAVSLAGTVLTALETTYAGAHWLPPVTAAISAALVWLVPNTPAAAPERPPAPPVTIP